MPIAPIDYGPSVQPDFQGAEEVRGALAQRGKTFEALRNLGGTVEEGAQKFAQMTLHTQASKATADAVQGTAAAMSHVENTPYADKATLKKLFGDDFDAMWNKDEKDGGIPQKVKDDEALMKPIPAFYWGRDYFISATRRAREEAAKQISLPGWQEEWKRAAAHEDNSKLEMIERRILAPQHVDYLTGEDIHSADRLADAGDFDNAIGTIQHSQILHGSVRRVKTEEFLRRKDQFAAQRAMDRGDVPTMEKEREKLASEHSQENYPNLTEKERLTLHDTLDHHIKTAHVQADTEAGLSWARDTTKGHLLPGSSVVDRAAMQKEFDALKGNPTKIKTAEAEMNRLMAEGDKAQSSLEGRAFIEGVDNIEKTGHMGGAVRRVLSNPNGTEKAGHLHETLMHLELAKSKQKDPIDEANEVRAWTRTRDEIARTRATGMTFEHFVVKSPDASDIPDKKLPALQKIFTAKQQEEKKNDEHPLSAEQMLGIRLGMKDAYRVDPNKELTPEQAKIHANVEKYLLDRRNAVQDAGGVVKPTDYAQWVNEALKRPDEMHIFNPWTWDKPWDVKSPAEAGTTPGVEQWEKGPDGKFRRKAP